MAAGNDSDGESREQLVGARLAIEIREKRLSFDFELSGVSQLHRDRAFGIGRQSDHIAVRAGDGQGIRKLFERRTIEEFGWSRRDRGDWNHERR